MELSQKKILSKKFKEIDRNNSINMKETRYDKTISERSIDTSIVEDYKDRIKKNVVPLLVVKEENKVNEAKNSYQVSFFKSYWLVNDGMCSFLVRPQTGFAYKKENLNGSHIEEYEFNYL